MNRVRLIHWLVAAVVLSFATEPPARAADDAAEEVLARNGLKRVGTLYVLEAEAQVKSRLTQARQLSRRWNEARMQRASVGTAKDHQELVRELTQRVSQIRGEIAAVNQQMGRVPRFRGRMYSAYAQAEHAQLSSYRNELNAALNQQNAYLSQLKSRPPDPKQAQKLDGDVASRRAEYDHAVSELIQLVESTKEKYSSLAKNAEIKKSLAALDGVVKPSPHLGPSHEFQVTTRLVERLEKLPPEPTSPPSSEPVKGHKKARSGR